jgi:intracellular sulfur oxidation DsrE/DsrF family protein
MIRTLTPLLAALLLATAPVVIAQTSPPQASAPAAKKTVAMKSVAKKAPAAPAVIEEKVVYHVNDAALARVAMRNIQNHITAAPDAKIVVVTHGKGIDFLLNDAKDDKGDPYQTQVAGLKEKGVDFRVCRNTLKGRNLDDSAVMMDANVVSSGVAEIGRLQSKEGFVYLKP